MDRRIDGQTSGMGKRKCGGLSGSDQGMCDAMDVHALAGRPSGRQLGDLPSQDGVRFCARARDGDADEVVLLRCCFMHCAAVFPCSDLRVGSLGGARKDQRKPTPVTGRLPSGLTTLLGGISVLATWELEGPLRVPGRPAHARTQRRTDAVLLRARVHIIRSSKLSIVHRSGCPSQQPSQLGGTGAGAGAAGHNPTPLGQCCHQHHLTPCMWAGQGT